MNVLFPFYLLINKDMTIDTIGKSMKKIGFIKKGDNFFDKCKIARPLQTDSFEAIIRQSSALFILYIKKDETFKFRGQMYYDELNDQICFLGSPLVNSFDDLKTIKLTLNDFAVHDNLSPFLFALQMQISSLKDSKILADRLEKSNQKLRRSNNELHEFGYILSHDLKSPLRGINSLAYFIEEDIKDNNLKDLRTHVTTIKERVVRMENLINGIMNITRIEMVKVEKKDLELNNLVEKIFEECVTVENIELVIKTKLPTIYSIEVLFIQLFSNFISNSVKYNDKEKGVIVIDYKESENVYQFSIQDNGPGISKKYHKKIFQLFQTLNTDTSISSTGIGLTIVKKIIDTLNGTVWLESKINEGTTFYFKIPKN